MTPATIISALASHTTATQERILLHQISAKVEQYQLDHSPHWLTEILSRCDAGVGRQGESAETFRVIRAKVQVYEMSRDGRLLTEVLELTKGD
jgi:hypothetical protein